MSHFTSFQTSKKYTPALKLNRLHVFRQLRHWPTFKKTYIDCATRLESQTDVQGREAIGLWGSDQKKTTKGEKSGLVSSFFFVFLRFLRLSKSFKVFHPLSSPIVLNLNYIFQYPTKIPSDNVPTTFFYLTQAPELHQKIPATKVIEFFKIPST